MQHLNDGALLHNGKYRVVKTLGQGSFGITYLAVLSRINMKVCIKEFFMKGINMRSDDSQVSGMTPGNLAYDYGKKFKKEAMNLARLVHSNIVRVIDFFEENGTYYYAMEYVDGQNLNDYIKTHPLTEKEALDITSALAQALDYMHTGHHMLHLDIKPSNVMRSGDGHIYLIDFGLSKSFSEDGAPETSTAVGLGTRGYAPPEQANAMQAGKLSPTVDIYSLGATMFKLLTGEVPQDAASRIYSDDLLTRTLMSRGVSVSTITLVLKAMSVRPENRFQTMKEFAHALAQCHGESTSYSLPGTTGDEDTVSFPVSGVRSSSHHYQSTPAAATSLSSRQRTNDVSGKSILWIFICVSAVVCMILLIVVLAKNTHSGDGAETATTQEDSTATTMVVPDETTELIYNVRGVKFKMKKVSGGTFTMGATQEQRNPDSDEFPLHRVTLTDYWLGETEVTQALWKAVMGSNPSRVVGDNLPVDRVSWDDCNEFIEKLNEYTGIKFTLPTEAQWEYAARGGDNPHGYQYSGSDDIDEVGWYRGNSSCPQPVAQLEPNELGLYDMTGNVWEWCSNLFESYDELPELDPVGPDMGSDYIYRGGCWRNEAHICRNSNRDANYSSFSGQYGLGLRLCMKTAEK